MSGKAYTMREMKAIVDYLTEHRAYGELKGRKMWMEYANSKLTIRTWQSLKETFLKRILPDITNPYYKLTVQQIASFRQGTDLEARIDNKLEIQTIHDDSSTDTNKTDPQPVKPNESKGANDSGEDILSSTVNQNRSSTDTVVIGPCYSTAEEIQKDLESPTKQIEDDENENPSGSVKSIRDYITYSEPLTPMLQEVLHDFASEDEGDEPQMQIVEYPESSKTNDVPSPIEILDTENNESETENNEKSNKTTEDKNNDEVSTESAIKDNVVSEKLSGKDKSDPVECVNDSEKDIENTTNKDHMNVTDGAVGDNHVEKSIELTKSQNNSNSITDTLPNNQEAFEEIRKAKENSFNQIPKNDSIKDTRKRSQSRDLECTTAKKKKFLGPTASDKNITPQNQMVSKVNFKETELKDRANLEHEKKNNHKVANLNNAHEVISEPLEIGEMPTIYMDHTYTVLDETLSNKEQLLQDVSIKTDEDEVLRASEDRELYNTKRDNTRARRKPTMQNIKSGYIKEVINEVVILKSQSESDSDHAMVSPKKNKAPHASHNAHRDRALANVFGFSSGVKTNHRHRKNVKRLSSHQRIINSSSSNEWTSDTGTEFVSPPRGRKNKQSRKYMKPKSARILSLEEEGGLFVMYRKKIYPVVKDGKIVKNYVTYTPDNDSEDDESYWKLKYVQEKKRTDELTKLLKHNKKDEGAPADLVPVKSPAPQTNICDKPSAAPETPKPDPPKEVIEKAVEQTVKEPEKKEEPSEPRTVKIQFMKDNESVQLEGHWTHIQPVLEQVVQILHKDPAPEAKEKLAEKRSLERQISSDVPRSEYQTPVKKQKLSRDSTPVSTIHLDEDVSEKINKMEEEIYMTIQERDLAESSHDDGGDTNVTKRRLGRPKKSTAAGNKAAGTSVTPPKRKPPMHPPDDESTDSSVVTRQQARTPRKANNKEASEAVVSEAQKKEVIENIANEGRITTRKSSRSTARDDGADVKYKLPSPPQPPAADNKIKLTKKTATKQMTRRRYPIQTARIFSSPDNISIDSIESTQGYQDSDASHLSICLRKKRKSSVTVLNRGRNKTQRNSKRKLQPYSLEDMSSDSNISFVTAPLKSSTQQSSSLNTEVYRSESYQLLFPHKQRSIQHLEKIEEKSPVIDNMNCNYDTAEENNSLSPAFVNYGDNSSNVTLPPSPVLSIVEKLSLSKSVLDNTKNIDIPNDSKEVKQTMLNDYMFLDVDMSVPLMEQKCDIQKSYHNETNCHFDLNMNQTPHQISDSLLNKVGAVNIAEPTLSESIHHKLNNLLLESAKKIAQQIKGNNNKEKANMMEICEPENVPKSKPKKRCSTPRKRQNKKSSRVSYGEPHIEQEHIESCENEKAYQKPILIVTKAVGETANVVTTDENPEKKSDRLKKKKDVIKVKILKPTMKKKGNSSDDIIQKEAKTSMQADSGINDTESGIFLRGLDDSIDLIHNHSDTCLQAHDCIADSLEIVDDNAISVISLNSNSVPDNNLKRASFTMPNKDKLLDICCENAQDLENLYKVAGTPQSHSNENSCIFKSPAVNISPANSLLTDDLSDEISPQTNTGQNRTSKWYLLSEDETSNTNNIDIIAKSNCNSGYGANLQEIFPITCAVPDLSTITEENTAKFVIDANSKSPFNSPSLPIVK